MYVCVYIIYIYIIYIIYIYNIYIYYMCFFLLSIDYIYVYWIYIYIYMNILYQAGSNYGLKSSLMFRSMLFFTIWSAGLAHFSNQRECRGVFFEPLDHNNPEALGYHFIREGLHNFKGSRGYDSWSVDFSFGKPGWLDNGREHLHRKHQDFPMKSSHFGMVSSQAPSYASLSKARRDGV